MLFRIPDLDKPLYVARPIMCRLCQLGIAARNHACQFCKKMEEAIKALKDMKLELPIVETGGLSYDDNTRRNIHHKLVVSNIVSGES